MSSFAAVAVILVAFVVIGGLAVALLRAGRGPRAMAAAALFAAFMALAVHHTGGLKAADRAWLPPDVPSNDDETVSPGGCVKVIRALEQNRVLLNRSNPDRVVVDGPTWAQLPPPMKSVITDCFERLPGSSAKPVDVVEGHG